MKTFLKLSSLFIFALCYTLTFSACGSNGAQEGTETAKEVKSDSQKASVSYEIPNFSYKEINGGSEYEVSAPPYFNLNIANGKFSKEVVIPSTYNGKPVTAIGANAFENIGAITKVIIPDSVTVIGKSAFSGCTGINSVKLGNATTKIENYAFCDCKSLHTINIPETLTYLGDHAFRRCSNLEGSITIPDGVTNSLKRTFDKCSKLTSVTIGAGVPKIGEGAFNACTSITSIVIPANVKSIENEAFRACTELVSVIIENDGVTHIEGGSIGGAFRDCFKLTDINFGNKLENIGENAFINCTSLERLTFPESLVAITKKAFSRCSNLKDIKFENSAANIGEYAFEHCTKLQNIDFGNSLVRIQAYAFYDCTGLTEITLPASLQYLGGLGMPPFMGCNKPVIKVKKLLSAPSGWAAQWNMDCGAIVWGQ